MSDGCNYMRSGKAVLIGRAVLI